MGCLQKKYREEIMPKYVRDITGKFNQRPHYEPMEIDLECEKTIISFLKDLYGKIEYPIQTDDLSKLIERHASDLDQYADLTSYGNNVEGLTEFISKKKPKVSISGAMSEENSRENRLRTTLTHELGHVIFHGYLYELELVDQSPTRCLRVCKRDDIVASAKTYPGANWMEWQAGYACGAFLMPASYVKGLVKEFVGSQACNAPLSCDQRQAMIAKVAEFFLVSKDAARVRLSVLGHILE
jgi:Zn-dependent peptidase ImmA (M78 family)